MRNVPVSLALLCLALGCSAPAPSPREEETAPPPATADEPAPDPAALWASCLEDPTRLKDCQLHVRLTRDDPGLAARAAELLKAHPGSWAAAYVAAYSAQVSWEHGLAEERYAAAADLARVAGDPVGEASSLFAASTIAFFTGRETHCLALLDQAWAAARASGDPDLQTSMRVQRNQILGLLAQRRQDEGRYWDERTLRLELLSRVEDDQNDEDYRGALYSLATNSLVLGLWEEAEREFAKVLRLARQAGDSYFVSRAETGLGVLALDARDGRALRHFESATATARDAGDERGEVYGATLVGVALIRAGRHEEARERLLTNLPRAVASDELDHLVTLVYLADAERLSGHEASALERYRLILKLAAETDAPEATRDALMGLAALQRSRGDAEAAIEAARRAEAMVESMRSNIAVSTERTHFLQIRSNTYQILAASLAQRDPADLAEPFAVVERAHARTLREVLAGRAGTEAGGEDAAPAEALDLKTVQARLAPGDLLLEFLLGEEESSLLAIDAEQATFHALPPRDRIEAEVLAYRDVLERPASVWTARPSFRRFEEQGHELFRLLLGLVAERIGAARRLIVVPDRQLHLLPFESLISEPPRPDRPLGFLAASHAIEYLPAAALLGRDAGPGIDRVIVVAATSGRADLELPPLRHAAEEVRAVVGAYPEGRAALLEKDAASLERLTEAATQPIDVLHLIAHAGLDVIRGPRVLLQGPEGTAAWLDTETLALLEHAPRLAILSACDTARGELVGGEGILGLVRAFTLAGSRQVVASLWKVDDARTSVMMGRLHQELRAGTPPSEAMRYARAEMLAAGYEHPFHWAGLVLYGAD